MDARDQQLRFLKGYVVVSTTLTGALALAAFSGAPQKQRFTEIDVERINIVESDGTLRLTISNHARLPDPVIGGKAYPLRSGSGGSAGLIFFNGEGNENGGLTYAGARTGQGYRASGGLSFDQFNQDETVTLTYSDDNGRRRAGLTITDRPDVSIQAFAESLMAIRTLPEGPERTRRTDQFRRDVAARGEAGARRVFVGKDADKAALVTLADAKGRPRLRLSVDSLGAARIEFLDESGHVTHRVPQGPAVPRDP
jgi:hypothetical protein